MVLVLDTAITLARDQLIPIPILTHTPLLRYIMVFLKPMLMPLDIHTILDTSLEYLMVIMVDMLVLDTLVLDMLEVLDT